MQTSIAQPTRKTDQGFGQAKVALAVVLALIAWRLVFGIFDRTELSTDEAQYWFWGQSFAFGAYSKPPLIGWINRLSTDLFGQSVAAVRVPAVLFHAATAAVIFACARRLGSLQAAWLAALLYLVSPAVVLGSALMTTDTPLLLAAAVAMLAQMQAGDARALGRNARGAAVVLGLSLGFGILAKHAMLFWLGGAVAAALLSPVFRPSRSDALIALAVMLAVIAPHLVWLANTRFVTVSHIQHITEGAGLSVQRPLQFIAEQFLVAGPITFAAIWLGGRQVPSARALFALVLVPLGIIVFQAVKGPVLANWAVLYLVPGVILAGAWLARHPKLALVALGLGLALSLAFPVLKVFGTDLRQGNGRPIFARYLGHSEVATWVITTANDQGAQTIVARDRDLLADLSWFSAGTDLRVRAIPPQGVPAHHWEMTAAFDAAQDPAPLVLLRSTAPLPCPTATEVARLDAPPGFAGGDTLILYRLADPACLRPPT